MVVYRRTIGGSTNVRVARSDDGEVFAMVAAAVFLGSRIALDDDPSTPPN
jgi:hypothetical protein